MSHDGFFFVRVKCDMPIMLVDDKMTIEFLNKSLPSVEIGKIFFCIILEKCDSVDEKPKTNAMLKLVDSQRKLATMSNCTFRKSSVIGHNYVKITYSPNFRTKDHKNCAQRIKLRK